MANDNTENQANDSAAETITIELTVYEADLLKQMLSASIANAQAVIKAADKNGMIVIEGKRVPMQPLLNGANMSIDIFEKLEKPQSNTVLQ